MIRKISDVGLAARQGFDAIIDVRSPGEFAQDHLPGAINLPVLEDAQRAVVGTEYVQGSKFRARRMGAAMVARNIADHLEGTLADRDGSFRPLVHCWRGGHRSGAMAAVMDQVGWTVTVLDGGYQTWRRAVAAALYDTPLAHRLVLLDGPTGSGKTEVLKRLAARGAPTLDLEGLANHRGSLFGAMPGGQPAQKLFESRLFDALEHLDPARPVIVEAESSKVGARSVPPGLWAAMQAAPRIGLTASVTARAAFSARSYAATAADAETMERAFSKMPRHVSKATLTEWRYLAASGDHEALATALIETHYDPAYRRSGAGTQPMATVDAGDLSDGALDAAADAVAHAVLSL